jgi:probable HAF family extracellular repeat protein
MRKRGKGAKALFLALTAAFLWEGIAAEQAIAEPTTYAERGYTLTDLGDLIIGVSGSRDYSINDRGQRAGEYYTAGDFTWHAYLDSGGTVTRLSLGGSSSWATAVNNQGQVIGRSHTPGDLAIHPFLYSDGTITDLSLGGSHGEAHAINDLGQVIGESYTYGDLAWHAFLYSDGTITDLNLGGAHSEAIAINDHGEVLGRSLTAGNMAVHAFLFSDGTITDLTRLVSDFFSVENFSVQGFRAGEIVGYGYRDGTRRAYILTVPR